MSTKIQQPSAPQAPTVQDSASAYAASLPTIYNAQLQYAPMFEQQNLAMTQQYAPQYKAIQDALYPELAQLDKSLASQAATAMTGGMPDYMKQSYQNQFRAEVGENAGSGIGADYVSRNMMMAAEQYRGNAQNLALTLTGRQPLYQATPGGYQQNFNAGQNYNYGTTSAFQGNAYGNYSQSYSSMYGANAQLAGQKYAANMNMIGQIGGGAATGWGAQMAMSSAVLKKDISKIENALDVIKNIEGVEYTWKNSNIKDGGVIAEQLEEVMDNSTEDISGIKHVKPMMIIGYLIEAVKELSAKIENQSVVTSS